MFLSQYSISKIYQKKFKNYFLVYDEIYSENRLGVLENFKFIIVIGNEGIRRFRLRGGV